MFIISLLMIGFIPAAGFAANRVDESFWDQAVETAEKSRCLIPGTIFETERVFDENGKMQEENTTRLTIGKTSNGRLDIRLMERLENSENTTEDFRDDFAENKMIYLSALGDELLFCKTLTENITLTAMEMDGFQAVYTFTLKVGDLLFNGWAVIDTKMKAAVQSSVLCPLVKKDGVTITNLKETTWYETGGDAWHPKRIVQTMDLETSGFLFRFKGKVYEETLLDDFFCHEEP